MAEEIEKIYVIPLRKRGFKSSKSAPTAVKRVKSYLTKHMKVEKENIWIDDSLNNAIWNKGKYKLASKIRVKAVKFEDGVVEAYLPELEFKKSRRELLKEEKEKKEPILKKDEEVKEEGETGITDGTEDYDIAPSADGEVKIKKKKEPKEKKEKPTEEQKTKKIKEKKSEKKTDIKEEKKVKKDTKAKKTNKKNKKKEDTKPKTSKTKPKITKEDKK
jgi:large subunit ribosomal protein L31e